ncbi:MAG: tRNA lysidine(34) synthetase TilS [Alphaproteobacteria bacterium]
MARLGPFERAPHVAVALSGGADSMALALLAGRWTQDEGGAATAITVDHGLRSGSAKEARTVATWCRDLGLAHVILTWAGAKPASGIQSAARAARYDLLGAWCRENRVLHLLTAHHLEDQAETVLLRLGRESGPDGLAAMPAVSEYPQFRLLRPLLDTPKMALEATLVAANQAWLEDPSNLDPAHTRTRVRAFTRRLADAGVEPQDLAATAAQHAAARAETDDAVAAFLASAAEIHAEGWCTLDPVKLASMDPETARRALARILVTIGGRRYAPRGAKLDRVWAELMHGPLSAARTLGGCRIVPWQKTLLICREPAAAREQISVTNPGKIRWDNRFALTLSGQSARKANAFTIARLGRAGWSAVASDAPALRQTAIPPPVRPSLPALWSGETVVAVPHLGYRRSGAESPPMTLEMPVFAPVLPLTKARFGVAK